MKRPTDELKLREWGGNTIRQMPAQARRQRQRPMPCAMRGFAEGVVNPGLVRNRRTFSPALAGTSSDIDASVLLNWAK
jgi:hypothetical protein